MKNDEPTPGLGAPASPEGTMQRVTAGSAETAAAEAGAVRTASSASVHVPIADGTEGDDDSRFGSMPGRRLAPPPKPSKPPGPRSMPPRADQSVAATTPTAPELHEAAQRALSLVTAPSVEPEAIEPEAIEPEAIEPEAIEPEAIEPEAIEPAPPTDGALMAPLEVPAPPAPPAEERRTPSVPPSPSAEERRFSSVPPPPVQPWMPAVDDEAQIAPVVLTRPLKAPRTLTVPEDEVPPKPLPPSCPIQVMRIIVVGESAPLDEAPPVIEPLEHDDDAEEIEAEVEEEIESAPVQQAEPMEIIEVELAVDVEPPLLDEAAAPVSSRIAPPPPPIGERKARAERKAAELLSKPKRRAWWEELFNEEFSRASLRRSDDLVRREADFIEHSLGLEPGATILDLGCGDGHHAVELAGRGYAMVGYDLSLYQLALAADMAQERRLKINFLQGDMRELSFEEMFDGVYSFNTSFGYFEEDKNVVVAQRIFRALRPGGTLLLDVANRDFITANTPCQQWYEGDTCVCMDDANVDYITSRLSVKRSVIMDDGRTLECHYSIRLYSLHELGKLLHDVGFRIAEASGHIATRGVFFGQSSPRILILAQRP